MKKIIAIFISLLFVFGMCSCAKVTEYDTPEEGIVGIWKYSPNEEYRELITDAVTDPGVYVDLFYEFYSDGTGKTYLSTDDTVMEFEYEYDGETLVIKGDDGSFDTPARLDGDILSVYDVQSEEYLDMKRQ